MSDELREKIRDYLMGSIPKPHVTFGEDADNIIALIRSHEDNRYSGLDAVRECDCIHPLTGDPNRMSCGKCHGTGTIRRPLTNKEAVEYAKYMAVGNPHVMFRGERVVVGGE